MEGAELHEATTERLAAEGWSYERLESGAASRRQRSPLHEYYLRQGRKPTNEPAAARRGGRRRNNERRAEAADAPLRRMSGARRCRTLLGEPARTAALGAAAQRPPSNHGAETARERMRAAVNK